VLRKQGVSAPVNAVIIYKCSDYTLYKNNKIIIDLKESQIIYNYTLYY